MIGYQRSANNFIYLVSIFSLTFYGIGFAANSDRSVVQLLILLTMLGSMVAIYASSRISCPRLELGIYCQTSIIFGLLVFVCLLIVLSAILPPLFWFAPGSIKYQLYEARNGFTFSFVIFIVPIIFGTISSKPARILLLLVGGLSVFLCLGRNPSLIYWLLLSFYFFRKFGFVSSVLSGLLAIVFLVLIDMFRAGGSEELYYRLTNTDLLDYVKRSPELDVNARVFEFVSDFRLYIFRQMTLLDHFQPLLGLFPFSFIIEQLTDEGGIHFARKVADLFPTRGGGSLLIEGNFYFGVLGAFVWPFLILLLIFLFLKTFLGRTPYYPVFVCYIIINSNRIDATTLINFAWNGMLLLLCVALLLRCVRTVGRSLAMRKA